MRWHHTGRRVVAVVTLLGLFLSFVPARAVAGEAGGREAGEPVLADVLLAVRLLGQELEPLRQHMGAPRVDGLDLRIGKAASHDLYFLAQSLFSKTSRLHFEITRQRREPPAVSGRDYRPADILALIDVSHQLLDEMVAGFGIVLEHTGVERVDAARSPDVFQAVLALNRQLKGLLRKRFEPSDVYMHASRAIGYAALLLADYPDATPIPDPPPFEPKKSPGDVFFRVLESLDLLQRIYVAAALPEFTIDAAGVDRDAVVPGDVADLTSLLLARLDYLHHRLGLTDEPPASYFPGRKYPSDVFQRLGIVLDQLRQIDQIATNHGLSWIKGGRGW